MDLLLELAAELSKALKTDSLDLVLLNHVDKPVLKYAIITGGSLLVEKQPHRLIIEPKILNEYFDFCSGLTRHKLTKAVL